MPESRKGAGGLRHIVDATRYSIAGLHAALGEAAFRLELLAAAVLIPAACYATRSGVERALLIGSVLLVLIIELLNSAVEAAVDRVSTEVHPLAKRAKDLGSAAVMLSLGNAAVVWLLVLL